MTVNPARDQQRDGADDEPVKTERPIDKLRREKENLDKQLKAATLQYRNAEAARDQAQARLKFTEDDVEWRRSENDSVRQQLAERPPPPPKPTALWPAPTRLPFCMDRPAPPLEMQPAKPPEQPPDSEQPPPDTEEQPPDREEPPPDTEEQPPDRRSRRQIFGDTNSDAVLRVPLTGVLDIEAIVRAKALHGLRGWRGKPSQKTQRARAPAR